MASSNAYLVCYDICNAKRLKRVHTLIRDFAVPVQYSVFETELTKGELAVVLADLEREIVKSEDKISFYLRHPRRTVIGLGIGSKRTQQDLLLF